MTLSLHSLRTFLSDLAAAVRPAPADDLCDVAEAAGVMADAVPAVDWAAVPDPTPEFEAARELVEALADLRAVESVEDCLYLWGEA